MKDGWEMKQWSEVLEIKSGRNQKEVINPDGKYPIIGSAGKIMNYANKYICDAGTTIIGRKGTINNPQQLNFKFWNVDTAFGLHALESLNKKYLFYFCLSFDFLSLDKGSGRPSLVKSDLLKIRIPLSPLPEQKEIVAILDKAFAAIDQAIANTEKNIQNAKDLFQSKLNAIFSQTGEGWEEKMLGDITSKIGSGSTPRGGQSSYKESGISLIRSMNVHDEGFKDKKLAFIDDEQADKLKNVIIQENDVLLNITGASVARCCIAPKDYLPARVNQHVSIIRLEENIMKPQFLHYALTSQKNKQLLLGIGEQGSTRQAITKVQLQNFKISYPKSLTEQNTLLKIIDGFRKQSNKVLHNYSTKINSLEELKKSILQKAFTGGLT